MDASYFVFNTNEVIMNRLCRKHVNTKTLEFEIRNSISELLGLIS